MKHYRTSSTAVNHDCGKALCNKCKLLEGNSATSYKHWVTTCIQWTQRCGCGCCCCSCTATAGISC